MSILSAEFDRWRPVLKFNLDECRGGRSKKVMNSAGPSQLGLRARKEANYLPGGSGSVGRRMVPAPNNNKQLLTRWCKGKQVQANTPPTKSNKSPFNKVNNDSRIDC